MEANMKRTLFFVMFLALVLLQHQMAFAQSAKAAVKVSNLTILDWTNSPVDWKPVLTAAIKTSQQKDLVMNVSMESGLWSYTLVKSKGGTADTSFASAGVHVRVLVDGTPVEPGEVVFAKRAQELTALFSGIFQECTDSNANGTITADECQFTNEEVGLLLDSMTANSFNFVLPNVGVGTHSVVVQASIDLGMSATNGQGVAKAMIGKGAITVEEVRLVQDANVLQF
jgi:hypothetical protein